MADFQLTVGTHKTLVPKATDPNGNSIGFPEGSVFAWTVSDPALELSDAASASPELVASGPVMDVTVTLTVMEAGFTHSRSHTVDAIAAPVDTLAGVDFDLI